MSKKEVESAPLVAGQTSHIAHGETPFDATRKYFRPPDEQLPRKFGKYELKSLLGRGGMGAVYLAHDPDLDREVAIKIPRPVAGDDADWRARFLSEARAAATLQHPNICPVFEVGQVDSQPYMAMAYIQGETLSARIRKAGKHSPAEAIALLKIVCRAMAEAHERGIVHRDLKPANIIVDRRGQPVVMDFGLAMRAAATDDLRLTLSGVAMGTPAYMPPEQAGGDHDAIGPASDVYSLGVILYELLTGQVPFADKSFGHLLAKICWQRSCATSLNARRASIPTSIRESKASCERRLRKTRSEGSPTPPSWPTRSRRPDIGLAPDRSRRTRRRWRIRARVARFRRKRKASRACRRLRRRSLAWACSPLRPW
jgi:serine/threonine protein kinase